MIVPSILYIVCIIMSSSYKNSKCVDKNEKNGAPKSFYSCFIFDLLWKCMKSDQQQRIFRLWDPNQSNLDWLMQYRTDKWFGLLGCGLLSEKPRSMFVILVSSQSPHCQFHMKMQMRNVAVQCSVIEFMPSSCQ